VPDFVVQQIAQQPVEVRLVRPGEHHFEVIALLPVTLAAELLLDHLVELRARQRVGHADAHVVRPRFAHQSPRRQDVVEFFTEISELQEEAHAHARGA